MLLEDLSMSEPHRSSSGASLESIDQEVTKRLHFRPISAAPLTPPKNSPGNGSKARHGLLTMFYLRLLLIVENRSNSQATGGLCNGEKFKFTLWT